MSFLLRGARRRSPAALVAAMCLLTAGGVRAEDPPIELMPDNSDVVSVIQVGKILKSPAFAKVQAAFPDIKLDQPLGPKTKLTPGRVQTVFVAANTEKNDVVVVVTVDGKVDLSDVRVDEEGKIEEIGDYELLVSPDGKDHCLVDDNVVAMGMADTLRAVLKRDDEAEISEELEAAWEEVDDTKPVYVVATLAALMKKAGAGLPPGFPLGPDTLSKLEAGVLTADAAEEVAFALDVYCSDAATAQQVKAVFDAVVAAQAANAQTPPPVQAALGGLKTSVEEETITLEAKVSVDLVLGLVKSQMAAKAAPPSP
jgi:hypothetical protein